MIPKFEGLIAAPFAPMDEKGAVVLEKITPYYNFLKKNNVKGAFINGSTGEGVSLTQKERQKIAEKWVEAAKEKPAVKIINLIGGTSYAECIENAQHSAEIGADAVALLAPYYFKPSGAKALAEFCARVAESVPQTPFYFYHIPVLSGCFVPMYDFLQEAAPVIPNLVGIKYTHEDFMDFLSCLRFMDGKYEMLWGRDENLLSALVLGATGGVGSTYNYAAPLYYQLIDAFNKGNLELARELQQKSIDMIRLLGKYGGIATGKAYMKYVGFDCGGFRLPIKNNWQGKYDEFKEDVQALKIENLFSTL
jgi:N-acetylneuraminate lyase